MLLVYHWYRRRAHDAPRWTCSSSSGRGLRPSGVASRYRYAGPLDGDKKRNEINPSTKLVKKSREVLLVVVGGERERELIEPRSLLLPDRRRSPSRSGRCSLTTSLGLLDPQKTFALVPQTVVPQVAETAPLKRFESLRQPSPVRSSSAFSALKEVAGL